MSADIRFQGKLHYLLNPVPTEGKESRKTKSEINLRDEI